MTLKHKCPSTFIKMALMASVLWLSACTIFPEETPQTRYNLPSSTMQPVAQPINSALYLSLPQANRLINSNYILVQPEGTEIQVYKGSQWADTAPALLQDRLVLALNDAQLFSAISRDAGVLTPYALQGYLSHFEVIYDNDQPTIKVHYEAQLLNQQRSTILASQRFNVEQPAANTDISTIVNAFGAASDKLSQQLIDWLSTQAVATP